ncbi:hypothetical protein PFMALIP_00289 [Plasmodium falciparum MaliPS096_E11]|uniref:RNA polymerase II subunit B1 CTD phosphatase RPAP2 homolog n=1 Tax=Plasmodium falciparum MaliPS096_E11 TaxID=1036727 RepID=A0A024WWR4_PLAFA|nr:hypothetical protein PFMALIP_00289 [Plasmodium falciparum MaliPS096_E11]
MSEESAKSLYEKEKKIQALSKIYHIKFETLLIYIIIPKTTTKSLCYKDFFDDLIEIKKYINIEENDECVKTHVKVNEEIQQRKTNHDNINNNDIQGDKNIFIKNLLVFINNLIILYFSKSDLIDVCINRRSYNKCGFYACDNTFLNNINRSKYKIDTKSKRIYLREYYDLFCSTNCMNYNLGLLKLINQNNKNNTEEINYKKKSQLIHIMFLTFFPFFKLYNLTDLLNNINKYDIQCNKICKIQTNINTQSIDLQQTDNNIIKMNKTNERKETKKKKIYNHVTNIKIKEHYHDKKQVFIQENSKDTSYIVKKKDKSKYILINNKNNNMEHKKSILKNKKDNQENTQKTNSKNVSFNQNIKLYQYNKDDHVDSYSIHDTSVDLQNKDERKIKKNFKETTKRKKKKFYMENKFNPFNIEDYKYTNFHINYNSIKELKEPFERYIDNDKKYEEHNIQIEDKLIKSCNIINNNNESVLNKCAHVLNLLSADEHRGKKEEKCDDIIINEEECEKTKEADHRVNEDTDDIKLQALLLEKKEKIREEYIQTFKSDISINMKLQDNDKHEYENFNHLEDDESTYDDLSYDHFTDDELENKNCFSNNVVKMNENKYIYGRNNGLVYENLSLYVVLWDIFTNNISKYTVHFFEKNEFIVPKAINEEERKRRNEFIYNISQNMPIYINCISSIIVNICRTFLFHKPLIPFKKVIYKSIICVIAMAIKLHKPHLIPSSEMLNIKKAEDYLIIENKIDQEELNELCVLFFQNNFY